jgi:hypothetical protein
MDFVWDVALRCIAMGLGIAFYSWLLALPDRSAWESGRSPSGNRE